MKHPKRSNATRYPHYAHAHATTTYPPHPSTTHRNKPLYFIIRFDDPYFSSFHPYPTDELFVITTICMFNDFTRGHVTLVPGQWLRPRACARRRTNQRSCLPPGQSPLGHSLLNISLSKKMTIAVYPSYCFVVFCSKSLL